MSHWAPPGISALQIRARKWRPTACSTRLKFPRRTQSHLRSVATTPARAAADDMGLGRDEGSPGLVEKGQLTMPLNVKTRSRVRSDTEFANSKRVSFADSVEIREYQIEELCGDDDKGLAHGLGGPEPATAAGAGRKRGRPPDTEEQKREKEVIAAEKKAAAEMKAFREERKKLNWWDAPSIVARDRERLERKADRWCELECTAIEKRHNFDAWRVATKEAEMARQVADLQAEMAAMKLKHAEELLLNEWYDMRERRRKWMAEDKAEREAMEVQHAHAHAAEANTLLLVVLAQNAVMERQLASKRLCLAWYDPRFLRLWRSGVL